MLECLRLAECQAEPPVQVWAGVCSEWQPPQARLGGTTSLPGRGLGGHKHPLAGDPSTEPAQGVNAACRTAPLLSCPPPWLLVPLAFPALT